MKKTIKEEMKKIAQALGTNENTLIDVILADWVKRAKQNGVEKLFTETK